MGKRPEMVLRPYALNKNMVQPPSPGEGYFFPGPWSIENTSFSKTPDDPIYSIATLKKTNVVSLEEAATVCRCWRQQYP